MESIIKKCCKAKFKITRKLKFVFEKSCTTTGITTSNTEEQFKISKVNNEVYSRNYRND